jgi:hypothetical protein
MAGELTGCRRYQADRVQTHAEFSTGSVISWPSRYGTNMSDPGIEAVDECSRKTPRENNSSARVNPVNFGVRFRSQKSVVFQKQRVSRSLAQWFKRRRVQATMRAAVPATHPTTTVPWSVADRRHSVSSSASYNRINCRVDLPHPHSCSCSSFLSRISRLF